MYHNIWIQYSVEGINNIYNPLSDAMKSKFQETKRSAAACTP